MNLKEVEGILFDFDGVIADTIEDLCKTWQKAFRDFDVNIKLGDYPPYEGMRQVDLAREIGGKHGREFTDKECLEIKKIKDKYYFSENRFKFFPEIHEIIRYLLENKKRLAIITSSTKEKILKTTSEDFLNYFEVIVTGEDTKYGKPNPDPYLAGLKRLNLPPEKCIVIENAPLGIKSSKSAGIYCVALATTLDKDYLKEADKIVKDHDELFEFLKKDSNSIIN